MRSLRVLWTGRRDPEAAEVEARLERELPGLVLRRARSASSLRRLLEEPWDLVLAAEGARGTAPGAVVRELQERGLTIPVLLLSHVEVRERLDELLRSSATAAATRELWSDGLDAWLPCGAQVVRDFSLPEREGSGACSPSPVEGAPASPARERELAVAGLVHDLNNLLMAIGGHGELARNALDPGSPARHSLDEALRAAGRARHLVEQLRDLGRPRQEEAARAGCLRLAAEEALASLAPALGPDVRVVRRWEEDLPLVRAGECELQRIVLNLASNALEALSGRHGTVLVALERVEVDPAEARALDLSRPGTYVRLRVSDDGRGMDSLTRARAFEPFFSTKVSAARSGEGAGAGRGLGLAIVRALVRARGGAVHLESRSGSGTCVSAWLPPCERPHRERRPQASRGRSGRGSQRTRSAEARERA